MVKYSDVFMDWLVEAGYTHCFYVSGGNVMHLLESASYRFKCVPFVHEVGACIAADYFNEISDEKSKCFLIVTAGPGLTNALTGIVGAWTESRELLIIGGQAKSSELSKGQFRQIGFQEIDGVELCSSVTKAAQRIDSQISKKQLFELVNTSRTPRKGPVFIEVCLDISTQNLEPEKNDGSIYEFPSSYFNNQLGGKNKIDSISMKIASLITSSHRPLILLGGGIERTTNLEPLLELQVPIATTFNGADRVGMDYEFYCGRPNWYGSRWANLLIQQADLVIALGTRLGLMQVGYNWEEFAPYAKIVQIEIDKDEIVKGFPKVDLAFAVDCNQIVSKIPAYLPETTSSSFLEWKSFIKMIRSSLNFPEKINIAAPPYVESTSFIFEIMKLTSGDEIIIPCSSGAAAYESAMRVIGNKGKQKMVTSHALASMGYGLSGAIGASFANPQTKTIVFEGDGGFAQNLQEIGTAVVNNLNLKIFIMDNCGYQSIRGNQKNSFNGHYVGCDASTGLGLPNWEQIGIAYGCKTFEINSSTAFSQEFLRLFNDQGVVIFVVKIDPEQTYWPRLMSAKGSDGQVISSPLHEMYPPLSEEEKLKFLKYLSKN